MDNYIEIALSSVLEKQGFTPVIDTKEKRGSREVLVCFREAFTWDTHNNVTVVYDERGLPWIKQGTFEIGGDFSRGIYVPHSNDNRDFDVHGRPVD